MTVEPNAGVPAAKCPAQNARRKRSRGQGGSWQKAEAGRMRHGEQGQEGKKEEGQKAGIAGRRGGEELG